MASGWSDHRVRSGRRSSTHLPENGLSGVSLSTIDGDRNDVPQRPPTVGQELPNNLDWPLDTQSRSVPRNRKRGNLEKNREKKLEKSGDGRSSDGLPGTVWPSSSPIPTHQSAGRAKQVAMMCDFESTSDGDANSRCTPNHGARPKKDFFRKKDRASFQSENELPPPSSSPPRSTLNKTKTQLNKNQVVSKLGQIRDYIKQVAVTAEALQKSGGSSAMEQMEKLYHFKADLQDYEHRLCEILHGNLETSMQADRLNSEESSSGLVHSGSFANNKCTSEGSADESVADVDEGVDAVEADGSESIVWGNELLRQVVESQEKLRSLQERNTVMLDLQHRAENRLAKARSFHGPSDNGGNSREWPFHELDTSHALRDDLDNIEQRLAVLRDLYDNRDRAETLSRSGDGLGRAAVPLSASESQRRELQDELMDLQSKKRQMDDLLHELCFLREARFHDGLLTSGGQDAVTSPQKHQIKSIPTSREEQGPSGRRSLSRDIDPTNKLMKLDEMKLWLQTLQVFSHQPSETALNVPTSSPSQPLDSADGKGTFDMLNRNPKSQHSKSKRFKKPKTNNISREQGSDCVGNSLSTGWMSHERQEGIADDDDDDEDDTLDENDSDFNKKICILHPAKNKFKKPQRLVDVTERAEHANHLPNVEYVEDQLNCIHGNSSAFNLVRANEASPSSTSLASSRFRSNRHSEPPARLDQSRSPLIAATANNAPFVSQAGDARRLSIDVSCINPKTPTSNARRKSNVTTHVTGRSLRSTPAAAAPNRQQRQASNHDLWDEMRHQMALQEELRQWELESLVHKDAGHKNYLLNQDNRSENMSASAKSECLMMNASTGATDGTTTATWGGSSVDNCIRDTVDGNDDSQEELNRRPNDEDCSSDEGVEVDNSVLATTPRLETHRRKSHNGAASVAANQHQGDVTAPTAWRAPDEMHRVPMGLPFRDPNASPSHQNVTPNSRRAPRGSWRVGLDRNQLKVPTVHAGGSDAHENRTSGEESFHVPMPSNDHAQSPPVWQQPPGMAQLCHQLESVMLLCRSLLGDRHAQTCLSEQLTASSSLANAPEALSPLPVSNVLDALQMQQGQMIVQQLLLGLSHCYHLLYLQQVEMQRIQQMLPSSISANVSCSSEGQCFHPDARAAHSNPEFPLYSNVEMESSAWHREAPSSMARSSVSSSSSQLPPPPPPPPPQHHPLLEPNLFMTSASSMPLPPPPPPPPPPPSQNIPRPYQHQTNTETLNNQVPPGNRANNYWDNFRSYSRQNLLSTSSSVSNPNKSKDCLQGHCMTFPRASSSSSTTAAAAAAAAEARNLRIRQHQQQHQRGFNDGRAFELVTAGEEVPVLHGSFAATRDGDFALPARENNRLGRSVQRQSHEMTKDKVNKNISRFEDGRNVIKNSGNVSPNATSARTNQPAPSHHHHHLHAAQPFRVSQVSSKTSHNASNSNTATKESTSTTTTTPSDVKDASSSNAVENSVYAEVVSLVSRFDAEPQHLVQLLREMHKLNDGQAMLRALRALRDLSLSDTSHNNDVADVSTLAQPPPPPPPPHNQPYDNSSRSGNDVPTSRPVYASSGDDNDDDDDDDDDDEAHFVKLKKSSRRPPFASKSSYELGTYSFGRFGPQQPSQSNASSAPFGVGTKLDFTPTSHSSAQSIRAVGCGGGISREHSPCNVVLQERSTSEGGASSSAQDVESETSMDAPCLQNVNMQLLEKQMQGIMISVTSYVASFGRQVCTPKSVSNISSHIMALVLPLVHNLNQDVQSFPAGQFACILENTLSKYVGKRFSDCNELLLSDLSEVLFNELGFLQVTLNADGHETKGCEGRHADDRRATISKTSPLPFPNVTGAPLRTEATDADLVVMARRGDDDVVDKMHEEFSCDIPDVCARRTSMLSSSFASTAVASNSELAMNADGFHRASTSALDNLLHSNSQPNYSVQLPEFGVRSAEAASAEGHQEDHGYFYGEVEIEAESMGDTQDLAEADQSQNYVDAEGVLNDVLPENGGDGCHHLMHACCTEDDRHNEDELDSVGGAVGGIDVQGDVELSGPELGLDEVPSKLRDPCSNTRSSRTSASVQQDEQQSVQQRTEMNAKRSL